MSSLFNRAKMQLQQLSVRKNSDEAQHNQRSPSHPVHGNNNDSTTSSGGGSSPQPKVPSGVQSNAKTDNNSRGSGGIKDRKITVHPVLDNEFNDRITPPRSPTNSLTRTSAESSRSRLGSPAASGELDCVVPTKVPPPPMLSAREEELTTCLARDPVDLTHLRRICWQGCPSDSMRFDCWLLLCGYHPTAAGSRDDVVARKRSEYVGYVRRSYEPVAWDDLVGATNAQDIGDDADSAAAYTAGSGIASSGSSTSGSNSKRSLDVVDEEVLTMKQIRKDIPRTSGGVPFLRHRRVTRLLERTLFIWALRHPACGYVQGMNDLVLPFLYVAIMAMLQQRVLPTSTAAASGLSVSPIRRAVHLAAFTEAEVLSLFSPDVISPFVWMQMEADFYWMIAAFLSGIQQNFTYDQSGVHAMVKKLEAVTRQVDGPLSDHLAALTVTFPQFAFRWMNCLLLREMNLTQALRLWDTYLSEETRDLCSLHVYVCASLLQHWRNALLQLEDFSAVITFLQNPPTAQLTDRDLGEIISAAYLKQQLYDHTLSHLQLNR